MVKNSDKKDRVGTQLERNTLLGTSIQLFWASPCFFLAFLKTWRVNNRTSLTELFDTGEKNGKSLLVTAERELYPDRASMKVENGRESIAVGKILKGARNNKKQSDMLLQAPSTEVVSFENSDVYKVTLFLTIALVTREIDTWAWWVQQEADDVLATAGVDTDDEARQLLFADSPRLQRGKSPTTHFFRKTLKDRVYFFAWINFDSMFFL